MNDPAIREAEASYLATAEVKPQARSQILPTLTLGVNRSHSFNDTEVRSGAIDPITGFPLGSRQQSEQD
ncbi:MAG TPA: TolC family protein, partial [Gammaproteobacteria bacterium]|nr:TolC family protein [Gammaproteobacteria bacterium]